MKYFDIQIIVIAIVLYRTQHHLITSILCQRIFVYHHLFCSKSSRIERIIKNKSQLTCLTQQCLVFAAWKDTFIKSNHHFISERKENYHHNIQQIKKLKFKSKKIKKSGCKNLQCTIKEFKRPSLKIFELCLYTK